VLNSLAIAKSNAPQEFDWKNAPKVHSIDITPEMKRSVMKEGQPISRNNQPQFDWTAGVQKLARPQAA